MTDDRDEFADSCARDWEEPEGVPATRSTWSDEYVRTIWTLVHRRDETIVELRMKLAEANAALRALRGAA